MLKKSLIIFLPAIIFARLSFSEVIIASAEDALRIAFENDREFKLEKAYAEEGVRLAGRNISDFLPQFDFFWSENTGASPQEKDFKTKSIGGGIRQKIFSGGKSLLQYKTGKAKAQFEFFDTQKRIENFRNQIIQSYYENNLQRLKCSVLKDAIENAEKLVEISGLKLAQGLILESDYLNTMVEVKQMELEYQAALDEAQNLDSDFKELIGISPEEKIILTNKEDCSYVFSENNHLDRTQLIQEALFNSIDLKKADAEIDWTKKQLSIQRRIFMPSISIHGGIQFSGRSYPLTQPSYSLKLILDFDNNPWLPLNLSRNAGFKDKRMNSITDSVSGNGIINTTYFSSMRQCKIDMSRKILSREKMVNEIRNNICSIIQRFFQNALSIKINEDCLILKEKKVEVCRIQMEQGLIKQTDFLDALNELSAQKIQVLSLENYAGVLMKELEIATGRKI